MLTLRLHRAFTLRTTPPRHLCRLSAEPGSRLTPRQRGKRTTPSERLLEPRKVEAEVVGIKEIVDEADLGDDAAPELTLLDGPLEGTFRTFSFHEGVDVFVPHNAAGDFNLAQCYLYDREARIYARLHTEDAVPDAFKSYQFMEWDTWVSGDSMNDVAETTLLHKVYFIEQEPLQKNRSSRDVNFEALYCVNGVKRTVQKSVVEDLTDETTVDPVLSILEDKILIRDSRDCPTMEGYALVEEQRRAKAAMEAAQAEMAEIDPELMQDYAQEEESLEEEPDVPDADNY